VSRSAAPPPRPALAGVETRGESAAWAAAGFAVTGGALVAGGIPVRPVAGGTASLALAAAPAAPRATGTTDLDGLPCAWAAAPPAPEETAEAPARHPNGVIAVDMVILFTGSRERTGAALAAAGMPLRKLLEGEVPGGGQARRGFARFANGPILEVVEPAGGPPGPARLWGLQFAVADLERAAAVLGPLLGEARDAVQPGRRIATVRREAGLGVAVALITPEPARPRA